MKTNMFGTANERKRTRILFVLEFILGLTVLAVVVGLLIWMNISSYKVLAMIFSNTAKQYSVPQDVVDEYRRVLMRHLVVAGISGIALMSCFILIMPRVRKAFTRIREIKSVSVERERQD